MQGDEIMSLSAIHRILPNQETLKPIALQQCSVSQLTQMSDCWSYYAAKREDVFHADVAHCIQFSTKQIVHRVDINQGPKIRLCSVQDAVKQSEDKDNPSLIICDEGHCMFWQCQPVGVDFDAWKSPCFSNHDDAVIFILLSSVASTELAQSVNDHDIKHELGRCRVAPLAA